MRIGNQRHRQLDFRVGEHSGIGRCKIRRRIIGGIETVGIDMMQVVDGRFGLFVGLAVADPERRVIAAGLERVDNDAVFLVADILVELAARHGAQLVSNGRIGCV